MPEGHSVHRIARQFAATFVGRPVAVSSPQGRFAEDAQRIDGHTMIAAKAVGKQMFLEFDNGLWLRVHLGIYGAWDFAGDIGVDPTIASANGRMGQTQQRGTAAQTGPVFDRDGENSLHSIGAPRRTRVRMSESEKAQPDIESFPPEPVGQVRVRLMTAGAVADLRGPTVCAVLDPEEVAAVIARLGPDPMLDSGPAAEEAFVAAVRKKPTAIALLLMDQSVVSGIGNVYRAELLFRARQNPHTPGKLVAEDTIRGLWRDWVRLLRIGVETGQMMTMDGLDEEAYRRAMAKREDRHWVYKREGLPCRVCGTYIVVEVLGGRKLYWCPRDQA
ncbi:DNA glycosylase [Leifsonia xyli subsp. cynodontis DSM 46306]|uniref:DNA-(apurinic or apyrimidinic site) lyase n=1 Tax=Leifsonia xyli subsp. cynodontis DSM 46306 TaxID=1389489 RepID=U3P6Z6_LEIXC|nr:DNA glycosylase [Leifsonia xyli]AGW41591.1 DNA glycosylase [Leifsonia xyli subsp. cynodontis DSM 46306]